MVALCSSEWQTDAPAQARVPEEATQALGARAVIKMRVSCRRTSSWSRHRAQSLLARLGVRRKVAELGVSARTFGPLGHCLKNRV